MPLAQHFATELMAKGECEANKRTPLFLAHGDADPVVMFQYGRETAERLKDWGWDVEFRSYP